MEVEDDGPATGVENDDVEDDDSERPLKKPKHVGVDMRKLFYSQFARAALLRNGGDMKVPAHTHNNHEKLVRLGATPDVYIWCAETARHDSLSPLGCCVSLRCMCMCMCARACARVCKS